MDHTPLTPAQRQQAADVATALLRLLGSDAPVTRAQLALLCRALGESEPDALPATDDGGEECDER